MRKLYILTLVVCSSGSTLFAQQTVRFSNYLFNKMIINPAAAGSNDYIEILGSYKKQWVGFNGSPQTSFLSIDGSTFDKRIGLGLQVVNDKTGALDQTGIIGNVASRIQLDEDKWLSLGFSTGWFRNTLNGSQLTYPDPNEIAIPNSSSSINLVDFKLGMYYKDNRNFGGVSVFNVFKPKLNYTGYSRINEGVLSRHLYLFAGRVFPINPNFAVIPSVLYKVAGNVSRKNQADLNAKLSYKGIVALGLSYRNNESAGLFLEYIHKNVLRFGYAFDFTTTTLSNYQSGSHEIMLAYRIIQNKQLIENPRYFYNN